ncbi:MAG TPA: hypothetical protein PLP17_13555 [Oligoflexia bacterium]|nr:hypothetical protein [Oligoflexia bacterium]
MMEIKSNSLIVLFGRVFWMLIGPGLMLLCLFEIVDTDRSWSPSMANALFIICLLLTAVARWIEFRGGEPRTADGEPAAPQVLQRYIKGLFLYGICLWAAANLAASYVSL